MLIRSVIIIKYLTFKKKLYKKYICYLYSFLYIIIRLKNNMFKIYINSYIELITNMIPELQHSQLIGATLLNKLLILFKNY